MTNNTIMLIEIDGCEGCRIAKNLTRNAIIMSGVTVEFDITNYDAYGIKKFCYNHNITDFPATVFIKNTEVLEIYMGTKPTMEIVEKIVRHFVNNKETTVEMTEVD